MNNWGGGVVPAHAMKTYRGSGGIDPLIFNLGVRWRLAVNMTPRPPYSQHRTQVIIEQAVWTFWGWGKNTLTIGDKSDNHWRNNERCNVQWDERKRYAVITELGAEQSAG